MKEEDKAKANAKFADISAAYEVLSDEGKRRIYDQAGEEGTKQSERGGGGGGAGFPQGGGFPGGFPGHPGGFHHQQHFGGGQGGGFQDPFHVFSQMFGGGGRGGGGGFPPGHGGGGGGPPPPPPVLYSAKATPDIQRLTRATFNNVASRKARGARLVLLHLYEPSSPSAQALAPALQRLAQTLKGAITVAAVNCAADRAVCAKAGSPGDSTDSALRLLHEEGSDTLDTAPLHSSLQQGRPPLKALQPVWDAIARRVPSRVGTLPASRAALDKLARRCLAPAGSAGKRRAVQGCVVLFSASQKVSPMYAALSSSPAFDALQPLPAAGAGAGAGAGEGEGAFVFAQAEVPAKKAAKGEAQVMDREHLDAAGALDLGVAELPALVLLLGSSLEEWRLGGVLAGEELRRAGRTGRVQAPKSALENTAAMAAWLGAQKRALRSA